MKGTITNALFTKFGINWTELYYEEGARHEYLQFSTGVDLYYATVLKGGNQVTIYKLDKAVNLNED